MLNIFYLLLLISISLEEKADVYMTRKITPSNMVKMFKILNVELGGKIGLKVHSGEGGGKFFLTPNFLEDIYNYTKGTYIECNAAYNGDRNTTERHRELLKKHGWSTKRFVIMDEDPQKDKNVPIENGFMIKNNYVGSRLDEFDSCIVLSHLKGHSMGGYGGALKQLSIGFASQQGKTWIHTAGKITDWKLMDFYLANQENFTAAMGDAASNIVKFFRAKKGIVFINVVANISKECDCAGGLAPDPQINDIGILSSIDPIALDRACIDLIKKTTDNGTDDWVNQLNNLKGENTIRVAEAHGIGTQDYNLIVIDEDEEENNNTLSIIVICLSVLASMIIGGLIIFFFLRNNTKKYQEDFHLTQKMNE